MRERFPFWCIGLYENFLVGKWMVGASASAMSWMSLFCLWFRHGVGDVWKKFHFIGNGIVHEYHVYVLRGGWLNTIRGSGASECK